MKLRYLSLYILILATCSVVFYSPILTQPFVYDFRDMPRVLLPFEVAVRSMLHADHLPLWNSMAGLGRPLFADPLSALTYPLQYFFRLFPMPIGWNLSIAFHHFIASVGAFLYLLRRGNSSSAALFAALCFSFGGYLVSTDNMLNALQSVAWFPWVFLCFESSILSPQKHSLLASQTISITATAIFVSLTFLGGMPEVVLYEAALLLLLGLIPKACGLDSDSVKKLSVRFRNLFLAGALTIGFSSVLLLPLIEYVMHSTRAQGLSPKAIVEFSFPISRLSEFFLSPAMLSKQTSNEWLLSITIGPALLLSLFAFLRTKTSSFSLWIALFTLFTILAAGNNIPGYADILREHFLFRIARHPEKFLLVPHALLCLSVAVGFTKTEKKLSPSLKFLLIGLNFLFLHFANSNLHPLIHWREISKKPATMQAFANSSSTPRLYADGLPPSEQPNLLKVRSTQQRLFMYYFGLFHGINNVNAPSSLNLAENEGLVKFIEAAKPNELTDRLRLFSVNYVTTTKRLSKVPELSMLGEAGQVKVYSVPNPKPLAYVPSTIYLTPSKDTASELLPRIALQDNDAVIQKKESEGNWISQAGQVSILKQDSTGNLQLDISMEQKGYIVINTSYYPGWAAKCLSGACKNSSASLSIYPANMFAQAVKVPAGKSKIEITFSPKSVKWGMLLTALTFVFVMALATGRAESYSAEQPCNH